MTYRIAMVGACPYPVPQGSQVLLRDTALGLSALGHEVHLVVYPHGLAGDAGELPIHRGRAVVSSRKTAAGPSFAKIPLDLALVGAVRSVVSACAIDIVHAHNYEGLLVALAAGKRPIVYHAHNAMADELPYYFHGSRWARRVGRWLDRFVPRRADAVIAPHSRLADYLTRCGCRPERLHVIPPPADASLLSLPMHTSDNPTVLYTGNLDAYQNIDLLVRAMEKVCAARPGTRLVVATAAEGSLPDSERVATPDAESLREVLARDAVFAVPRVSWSGYPIKMLNAMAAGRAIVSCASAAHPLRHEENGLVVPDDDVDAFATALIRCLNDSTLRRRLGEAARATAIADHDPHRVAEAIEEVYRGTVQ